MAGKSAGYLRRQEAVAELGQAALSGLDFPRVLDKAVFLAAEGLGVEFCKILEFEPGRNEFLLRAGCGWRDGLVGQARISAARNSCAGFTLEAGEPVIVTDLARERRFSDAALLADHNIVSGISVAISNGDRPYGVFGAHSARSRDFSDDEVQFVRAMANMLALIVGWEKRARGLKESEELYHGLVEASADAVIVCDPDLRVIDANLAAAALFGRDSANELIRQSLPEMVAPGERSRLDSALSLTRQGEGVQSTSLRLQRKDGSRITVQFFLTLAKDYEGKPSRIVAVVRDITATRRTEKALRKSRERLADTERITRIGTVETYFRIKEVIWSEGMYRILGLRYQEVEPSFESFLGFVHPEDVDAVKEFYALACSSGEGPKAYDHDYRIIRADGRERIINVKRMLDVDEEGQPIRMVATMQDITERKWAELSLKLLQDIVLAISTAEDLDSALEMTLSKVCAVTGWTMGEAWVLSDEGSYLECSPAWYTRKDDLDAFRKASQQFKFLPGIGMPGQVWKQKQPVWMPDVTTFDSFARAKYARESGLRAGMGIPVLLDGEVLAVMNFFVTESREEDKRMIELVSAVAAQLGSVILRKQADEKVRVSVEKLQEALAGVISTLEATIELRDPYTASHQRRVSKLGAALARVMELPEESVEAVRMAGLLHDIGKISVPAEILTKPGAISEFEFSLIKGHPRVGYDILKGVDFPWPIARIVHEHHERMDGSGYPDGLKGENICLEARIMAVCDVVEAMASHRPYRPSRGLDAAMEEIETNRGTAYDEDVVDACLSLCLDRGFSLD